METTLFIITLSVAIYNHLRADLYRRQRDTAYKELKAKEYRHINEALMYSDLDICKRLN